MKYLFLFAFMFVSYNASASVPYCNIAEIVDFRPSLTAAVKEFKKSEMLELSTKDNAAKVTAEWNEVYYFYQINLFYGDMQATTLVERPGKMGFLSIQDGKRNFQALCRFEVN